MLAHSRSRLEIASHSRSPGVSPERPIERNTNDATGLEYSIATIRLYHAPVTVGYRCFSLTIGARESITTVPGKQPALACWLIPSRIQVWKGRSLETKQRRVAKRLQTTFLLTVDCEFTRKIEAAIQRSIFQESRKEVPVVQISPPRGALARTCSRYSRLRPSRNKSRH